MSGHIVPLDRQALSLRQARIEDAALDLKATSLTHYGTRAGNGRFAADSVVSRQNRTTGVGFEGGPALLMIEGPFARSMPTHRLWFVLLQKN
jgi:hypothetical protein